MVEEKNAKRLWEVADGVERLKLQMGVTRKRSLEVKVVAAANLELLEALPALSNSKNCLLQALAGNSHHLQIGFDQLSMEPAVILLGLRRCDSSPLLFLAEVDGDFERVEVGQRALSMDVMIHRG